jgi:tetratricopeptide (TPR) repeat protein
MKISVKSGIAVAVITGVMGLSGVILTTPTLGQVISQVSTQDTEALAEAERLNDQAVELYQQGKYNEAIPLAEQALAIRKKQLGDNHPDTATSLNNLAGLYRSQGRYAEAEPLYQEALAIIKQQLGDNHPATASSLNNLALESCLSTKR